MDKAEDCCDRIESTVLGLANQLPDPQELDRALRAAHSVKGGAAMMGFIPLSRVAHQLEDFFKILRVRYHSKAINTEVETLLLQGVDCLRQVSDLHRQGATIDDNWFATRSQPIFDRLRQHLGELRPEDEDALLSQEGDLARQLADKAIKAWRKSHSLVLLGRFEGISDRLPQLQAPAQLELDRYNPAISDLEGITDLQPIDLTALQFELAHLDLHAQSEQMPNWDEIERAQLPSELVSELEFDLPLPSISRSNWDDCESSSNNFLEGRVPPDVLSELAALEVTESFSVPNWDDFDRDSSIDNLPSLELLSELAAFEIDGLPSDLERDRPPLWIATTICI
ncbi:Hpt domain-containing protein [Chamaesiphon sp. GL140_3_metabinner_50]|uniref:Hpt domain-containing protein n=1 Tax=Chamaesiphon sp. GL140_3_metabinner_50 TaxID=2970812 RepID=UPI0025D806E5|nr:Hpt domain-containing protein [Chamaesiphon sp. GL140_3_metabinner_50]